MCLDFYSIISSLPEREFMEKLIIYNISPVIVGVKPSSTLTFKKNEFNTYEGFIKYGEDIIKNLSLNYIVLKMTEDIIVTLIYDEKKLLLQLSEEETKNFLVKLGYDEKLSINSYLNTLKERYDKYHCPHEIGLFLGIHFRDVNDFINCSEKKCLLCGYWKVFNNEERARKLFKLYDDIKLKTQTSILNGYDKKTIIMCIKALVA